MTCTSYNMYKYLYAHNIYIYINICNFINTGILSCYCRPSITRRLTLSFFLPLPSRNTIIEHFLIFYVANFFHRYQTHHDHCLIYYSYYYYYYFYYVRDILFHIMNIKHPQGRRRKTYGILSLLSRRAYPCRINDKKWP